MAKDFYTLEEAQEKLTTDEPGIKNLVRQGKLREFRQDGKLHYKAQDVDTLAAGGDTLGLSATGEIVLEPADGSTAGGLTAFTDAMDLTAGGDLLSLSEDEEASKPADDEKKDAKKDDTVFTSIGVSVFEEDELEIEADSGAKTILSDSDTGSMPASLDSSGSGSGLLDLTRESDDTSLGAELLDEIYPKDESGGVGEATAAGVADELAGMGTGMGSGIDLIGAADGSAAASTPVAGMPAAGSKAGSGSLSGTGALGASAFGERTGGTALGVEPQLEVPAAAEAPRVQDAQSMYLEDPYAGAFTGVMLVTVAVLGLSGAVCAAFLRGAWPGYLDWLSQNLMMFGGASLGVTAAVLGVGLFMGRPSSPSSAKPKKEKKVKAKKVKAPKVKKEKKTKKKK